MAKLNIKGMLKRRSLASGLLRARARHARIESVSCQAIIERDNQICYICGLPVSELELDLDHVKSLELQGDHTEGNLAVVHRRCNLKKGRKTLAKLSAETGMLFIKKDK